MRREREIGKVGKVPTLDAPKLDIQVQPSDGNNLYYLPLAPKFAGQTERLKIGLRLKITNLGSEPVRVTNITFSYPGTSLEDEEFTGEQDSIDPEGGEISPAATATWSNGRVGDVHNEVYLDAPAPAKLKINVHCNNFTFPDSVTMDLVPWVDPTGHGPVIMPFAVTNLEDDEYLDMSGEHGYPGGSDGKQIFAHDIRVIAQVNGTWTSRHAGMEGNENSHIRIFGMPVRAIADGTVFHVVDQWDDNNPVDGNIEGVPVEGNHVWITHGNLEVEYGHLRRGSIIVSDGQTVKAGQKLGEAGNSGNTKGTPHLHLQGRDTTTNTLRGFVFKNAWMVERSKVPPSGPSPRVQLRAQGICKPKAVVRPFRRGGGGFGFAADHDLVETLVAEVFGGTSQGGDGFVIVGGKFVKVPPRGPKWDLLQSLIKLDGVEQLDGQAQSRARREVAAALAKISKELGR